MTITRYRNRNWLSPWNELDRMSLRLNRFFGESGLSEPEATSWIPAVNVEETNDNLILTADLPGLTEENIEIAFENGVLTIRGQKKDRRDASGEDRRYHVSERWSGSFQRSFTLPRTVSVNDISATFEHGVLRVHMPKAAESKGRTIQIRSAS